MAHIAHAVNWAAQAAANTALQQSPYYFVRKVTCHCVENAVVLEGEVPTFYQKQLAQEALSHLRAMPPIDNRIQVRGYRSDGG